MKKVVKQAPGSKGTKKDRYRRSSKDKVTEVYLPNEILLEVFLYVPAIISFKNLALVNKRFYELIESQQHYMYISKLKFGIKVDDNIPEALDEVYVQYTKDWKKTFRNLYMQYNCNNSKFVNFFNDGRVQVLENEHTLCMKETSPSCNESPQRSYTLILLDKEIRHGIHKWKIRISDLPNDMHFDRSYRRYITELHVGVLSQSELCAKMTDTCVGHSNIHLSWSVNCSSGDHLHDSRAVGYIDSAELCVFDPKRKKTQGMGKKQKKEDQLAEKNFEIISDCFLKPELELTLDMRKTGTLSYTVNGKKFGVAHDNLKSYAPLRPCVTLYQAGTTIELL